MKKFKTKIQVGGMVLLPLFLCSCFLIKIKQGVDDPDSYFHQAYRQIERIHRAFPEREGRARHINILVYESSSRQLIQIKTALWFVDRCLDLGSNYAEWNGEISEEFEFDWRAIKDLGQLGPGLMVEVEAEEEKVLIWLR